MGLVIRPLKKSYSSFMRREQISLKIYQRRKTNRMRKRAMDGGAENQAVSRELTEDDNKPLQVKLMHTYLAHDKSIEQD